MFTFASRISEHFDNFCVGPELPEAPSEVPEVFTFGSRISEHLDHFWEPFQYNFALSLGPILDTFWLHVGPTLEPFWKHFGSRQPGAQNDHFDTKNAILAETFVTFRSDRASRLHESTIFFENVEKLKVF